MRHARLCLYFIHAQALAGVLMLIHSRGRRYGTVGPYRFRSERDPRARQGALTRIGNAERLEMTRPKIDNSTTPDQVQGHAFFEAARGQQKDSFSMERTMWHGAFIDCTEPLDVEPS